MAYMKEMTDNEGVDIELWSSRTNVTVVQAV